MIRAVLRGIVTGAVALALLASAWSYYDVAVNHKDMFGYASVYLGAVSGALLGGILGGLAGFVMEGMRRGRNSH